jgi:O-antigen ligase
LQQSLLRPIRFHLVEPKKQFRLLFYTAAVLGATAVGCLVAIDRTSWAVALAIVGFIPLLLYRRVLILKVTTFLAPICWLPFVPLATYETFRDALFLGFLGAVAGAVLSGQLRFELPRQGSGLKFIVIFLLAMVPSVLISSSISEGSVLWLRAVMTGLFYIGLLLVVDAEEQVRQLLILFMAGQLLSVGVLWLEVVAETVGVRLPWDIPFTLWTYSRAELGLSYRRTGFSGSTAHILPIVLGLAFAHKRKLRAAWVFVLFACFAAILVSRGRGGLLAGIIVVILMLWEKSKGWTSALLILALLVAFIAPSLITDRFIQSPEWMRSVEGLQWYDRLSSGRLSLYIAGIEMVKQHPFFGKGQGAFAETLGLGAHNLYLEVAGEAGIVSASALITFMIWALVRGWTAYRTSPKWTFATPLFGILVAQFVTSLVETGIFWNLMQAFPFWIALTSVVKFYSRPKTDVSTMRKT